MREDFVRRGNTNLNDLGCESSSSCFAKKKSCLKVPTSLSRVLRLGWNPVLPEIVHIPRGASEVSIGQLPTGST